MPPVCILLLRTYPVQNYAAHKAATYLSKELGTHVEIGGLRINWLLNVVISDLKVLDKHNKVMIGAGKLRANLRSIDPKLREISLKEIALIQGNIHLATYKGEKEMNLQFLLDYFSPAATSDTTTSNPWKIRCSNAIIKNTSFTYLDEASRQGGRGIDFADIGITDLNLELKHITIAGDTLGANVKHLSFIEKSGFGVNNLSSGLIMAPGSISADSLKIETPNSNIALNLKFVYPNANAFSYFVDSVHIQAGISPSKLDMRDIVYFAPDLYGMDDVFNLTGNLRGTVSSFSAKEMRIAYGDHTAFAGNIKLTGLPDWTETFAHFKIDEFITHVSDIERFTLPYSGGPNTIKLPQQMLSLGNIRVKGKFTGFYNDFVSKATFETDAGTLASDILLSNNRATKSVEYDGRLLADKFNAGKVFGIKKLGTLNLDAVVKGKDFSFANADLTIEGKVTNLEYEGNTIGLINIDGAFKEKKFVGGLKVNDELIAMNFNGKVDLSEKLPFFDFESDLTRANLMRLHILPQDSITALSTKAFFSFRGSNIDNMIGSMHLLNTNFNKGKRTIRMNNLSLITEMLDAENKRMSVSSDFADAEFTGNYTFADFSDYITLVLTDYLPSLMGNVKQPERANRGSFEYSIKLKNTDPVSEMFLPWVKADPQTVISGSFNPGKGLIYLEGNSPLITVKGISLHNWKLKGRSENQMLTMHMASDAIDMSAKNPRDTSYSSIDQLKIFAVARGDSVFFNAGWDDFASADHYKGNLTGTVSFAAYPRLGLHFHNADITISDTTWSMLPDNYLSFDTSCVFVHNLGLVHGSQHLLVNGTASSDPLDRLLVNFKDFNISNSDFFLNSQDIDFDGYLNGEVSVSDAFAFPRITAGLNVKKFGFNHEFLGDADIISSWDNENSLLSVDSRVVYVGNVGTHYPVKAYGKIYPGRAHNNFDLAIDVDNLKVRTMEPFFTGLFSRVRGLASGNLTLTGDFSDPVLKGSLRLMRSELLVDYVRTSYSFTGDLNFDKDQMWFKDIHISDSTGSTGIVSGTIKHRTFSDWAIDISLAADKLTALSTPYNPVEMYYGNAKVTGNMTLKGPVDNLVMKAKVTSEKGTAITIPISFARSIGDNDFIRYKIPDTLVTAKNVPVANESSVLSLDLGMDVTRDAEINIILPYQMGNIQARGDGLISMGIDTRGDYSMHGQYLMDKGNFLFNFENVFKRNFEIQKGGTITFNGSPYDADINLEAVYKIKTTLGGLPNIDPQYSSRRIPVDCIIKLSSSLYNPNIRFNIALPDASEEMKRMVFSSIDTSNIIAMNQQMISLLVLNSFSSTSGIALNNTSLGSSSYDFISNQLSNWLSQISKDFDIGVNYRPGDLITPQELELALSTQLFNNRVSIESSFGRNTANNTVQTSRWVGDVLVEVKITEDGRFRVKAFNRTNTSLDLYAGQAPYTQGVGVIYRKDFNRFGQLLKRKTKQDSPISAGPN